MAQAQETGGSLRLEIFTPAKRVAELDVPMVTLPGMEGYFGVLPGHMPLITKLKPGVVSFEEGGMPRKVAVTAGIVETLPDRVIILARTAEFAKDVDAERARRAMAEAEKRMAALPAGDAGLEKEDERIRRAQARLQALEEVD